MATLPFPVRGAVLLSLQPLWLLHRGRHSFGAYTHPSVGCSPNSQLPSEIPRTGLCSNTWIQLTLRCSSTHLVRFRRIATEAHLWASNCEERRLETAGLTLLTPKLPWTRPWTGVWITSPAPRRLPSGVGPSHGSRPRPHTMEKDIRWCAVVVGCRVRVGAGQAAWACGGRGLGVGSGFGRGGCGWAGSAEEGAGELRRAVRRGWSAGDVRARGSS